MRDPAATLLRYEQLPPEQDFVQPLAHFCGHLPPAQSNVHVALAAQVCAHAAPVQDAVQIDPVPHDWAQLPPVHENVHS